MRILCNFCEDLLKWYAAFFALRVMKSTTMWLRGSFWVTTVWYYRASPVTQAVTTLVSPPTRKGREPVTPPLCELCVSIHCSLTQSALPSISCSIHSEGSVSYTVRISKWILCCVLSETLRPIFHLYPFIYLFSFLMWRWDWVHLVRRPLIGPLYQPRMIVNECGAFGWMRIGKRNGSTRRKPVPVPLCPPQIPNDLTRDRTRAAIVGSLFQSYGLWLCRGGFPRALRPYMVYCTSPIDIQQVTKRTHRGSPPVPPTREQRN
jgi:hypothetical protein